MPSAGRRARGMAGASPCKRTAGAGSARATITRGRTGIQATMAIAAGMLIGAGISGGAGGRRWEVGGQGARSFVPCVEVPVFLGKTSLFCPLAVLKLPSLQVQTDA
jgi:hypothetical protein